MISLVIFPVLILIYINFWAGYKCWQAWKASEYSLSDAEKFIVIQFILFIATVVNYLMGNACLWAWAYGY